MLMREQKVVLRYVLTVGIMMILLFWLASRTFGQDAVVAQNSPVTAKAVSTQEMPQPAMKDYRGIKIGSSEEEVLKTLDKKPDTKDKSVYFYIFSDSENAQIVFDKNRMVRTIAVTYLGKDANAPTYEQVFGPQVPVKSRKNGKIYNRVKYAELGYWITYSSLGTEARNPLVSITIQRARS